MTKLQDRIESYENVYCLLNQALESYKDNILNEVNHLALIQGFELCFEMAKKVIKEILAEKNIHEGNAKKLIATAHKNKIIKSSKIWLNMLKDKTDCTKDYDEERYLAILNRIDKSYYKELTSFKDSLANFA